MKNYRKLLSIFTAAGCLSLLLSSCLKQNKSDYPNPNLGLLTFIQASPDQPGVDLYLDANMVNAYPVNYANGINYFQVYTGSRKVNVYASGTQTRIASDTIAINANAAYSLFLANTTTKPELLFLTDSLAKPADGKATIRFINLSPDAPAVDLAIKGGDVIVANKAFKGYSPFLPVAGSSTYTFEVRQAGTSTVLATLSNVSINTGFVYTIWFHGLATPVSTTDKLTASLMNNAYY